MSCLAYLPERSTKSLITLGAAASLAFLLSSTVSPRALAACVAGTVPNVVECDGSDNENTLAVSIANPGAARTGVLLTPIDEAASLLNSADIEITDTNFNNINLIGINTRDVGEYEITNDANITIVNSGRGQAYGIAGNGDVEELAVENEGTISVTRGSITLSKVTATSLQSGGGNLAVAAGIFAEEELETLSIENNGTITASGLLAAGVYSRAGQFTLENNGTIEHTGNGIAIAAVSDSGETRTADIENEGTITGDVMMVGGHAQRWWALSNGYGTDGATIDSRLEINSQFGQLDSTIANAGTISGNFYYGNGTHNLVNGEEGEITGNIDVDQRTTSAVPSSATCWISGPNPNGRNACPGDVSSASVGETIENPRAEEPSDNAAVVLTSYSETSNLDGGGGVGATYSEYHVIWGTKSFTFENAGEFEGDLTVRTQDSYLETAGSSNFSITTPESTVTLIPHLFGGGSLDKGSLEESASAFIDGTLKVWNGTDTTLERTTTIAPVVDSLVKNGEWYLIADEVVADPDDVPNVEESVLVHWTAATDAGSGGNSLAIQANVQDASVVSGLSASGITTVNALMNTESADDDVLALGGALQNLKNANDVRIAGEQLAPETNFATQQAALTLAFLTGQHIDNRLANVGATGNAGPASGFAEPSGLGMKQAPEGRMSLGAYGDEAATTVRLDRGGMWGQAFGAGLDQSARANVDGYGASIYGAIAGIDNWVAPGIRLGIAGGYGYTDIDGAGDTEHNATQIDSYLGIVYGAIKGTGWYASGHLGYAWNQYDTTRVLSVPFKDVASASHDGRKYTAAAEVGSPFKSAMATFTPVASLNYSYLDQDGYKETSGGGMALTVQDQETTSLQSGLGVKLQAAIAADTLLEGRAIWFHEFEDASQQVTAAFGGAPSFTASGPSVGRDTADLGVGLFAYTAVSTSFQLNYDALVRDDFVAHTGSGRVRMEF